MYINFLELMNHIRKRQVDKAYVGMPFGSAIRYKRKELNMTLEEVCEGICSLSYLSKVENNLICASEEYIEKLKKRLNLNDAYDYDLDTFKIHIDHIIHMCLKNQELDEKYVLYYENREDYQSIIVQFAYYVLKKDYVKAEGPYRDLLDFISSVPNDAFMVSIILINRILFQEMRYIEGMELLELSESHGSQSKIISLLVKKWKLNYSFKIKNHLRISKLYQPLQNELAECHLFDQVKINCFNKLIYESKYKSLKEMEEELNQMILISKKDKDYIVARCHYYSNEYHKVLDLSKLYLNSSSDWLILHLLTLDKLKESKAIIKIMSDNENQKDPLYLILSNHLKIKYKGKQEDIITYIKRDVLSQKPLTDDYEMLEYLMKDCDALLTKFQYYKDAVSVYRLFTSRFSKMMST
jgi:HTH-type transcriptional regulator, quorum sensing regulator NprR